ncbi:unnamed protein product [Didymodactylos carnosus]|uniref:Uncharacterized protein n=1 Tax=Didymodactylos carnosus TaxID=1234261 RepID=A0A814Q0Z8_9BILA|nr:unnamed protein product [Didymodactylos carnosus]CAF1113169.1 unnamed protein product [Didymodactylos carnosus]CAF3686211.1 unnamed protein product [Didymodactylos carnosus]CAF3877339.1 unnamed protein product [Didymodactylos carnosus]
MASVPYCFNIIRCVDQKLRSDSQRRHTQSESNSTSPQQQQTSTSSQTNDTGAYLFGKFIPFRTRLMTLCGDSDSNKKE